MKKTYQPPLAEFLLLSAADILSGSMETDTKDDFKSDLGEW